MASTRTKGAIPRPGRDADELRRVLGGDYAVLHVDNDVVQPGVRQRLYRRRAQKVRERAEAPVPGVELLKYAVFHIPASRRGYLQKYYHSSPAPSNNSEKKGKQKPPLLFGIAVLT